MGQRRRGDTEFRGDRFAEPFEEECHKSVMVHCVAREDLEFASEGRGSPIGAFPATGIGVDHEWGIHGSIERLQRLDNRARRSEGTGPLLLDDGVTRALVVVDAPRGPLPEQALVMLKEVAVLHSDGRMTPQRAGKGAIGKSVQQLDALGEEVNVALMGRRKNRTHNGSGCTTGVN